MELLILTTKGKQPLMEETSSKNLNSVNLDMTLAPGGKPMPHRDLSMKILLWLQDGNQHLTRIYE